MTLALIHIFEGVAEGLRKGTIHLTEDDGREIIRFAQRVANPSPVDGACTLSQACLILDVSAPTFRKYIRQGLVPAGYKVPNIRGKFWDEKRLRDIRESLPCKRKVDNHV